jgi:hypothetical protein
MKTGTIILSAAFAFCLVSCKKNTTDVANSGLEFQLKATNPSSTVARVMTTITWDSGFVNATEIKFEAKQNGQETKFRSSTPKHIDLFATASTIGLINIPSGTFDEVEFKIEAAPSSTEPAVQLNGKVNGTPVVFMINTAFEIKSEQSQVTLNGADIALNKIDLSALTSGLSATDFANAAQANGRIVLSSSSNTGLFNTIVNNLQKQHETEVEVHHR